MQRTAQAVDDSETEPTESAIDAETPMVQGAWYETQMAVSRVRAVAGFAPTAPEAVAAAPAASHPASEGDMDELAGKLYDRIRTRLKTELLVDRERAGFLTDLR